MFATTLLNWFAHNGRDLPWRHTTDPYAIWLSEIILQQTRIQQGHDYWLRFMQRWPRVEDLAAATEDEVLRLWQGLGYYSRARNLHTAAQQIVELGHFPDTLEGIRQLKGVGDYTAAAIGSIAFGLPCAVVDGNVYRVLSRHYGIDIPINTTQGKKIFTLLAQSLLPTDQPAAFNQAMMDFGAIQCTPQSPRCVLCPLQESCDALHTGRIDQLPVKQKTLKVQTRRLAYLYLRHQGQTAIRRRPAGDIWQGLWEPVLLADTMATQLPLPEKTAAQLRSEAILLRQEVKHVLTHRILLADFYFLSTAQRPQLPAEYIWIPEEQLGQYALPRLIENLLAAL
ncbi:MAG: A/G-specific adenine glycosylase [Bacteroidaceae bacterium]|nr:A/G-specific adenine glycosylase [Bacteroidaceae bacterium]MBQ9639983.1 A/G-specific adenine glycosylase [Bacteroidaceae bacterium]